jgi:hypothetical protein
MYYVDANKTSLYVMDLCYTDLSIYINDCIVFMLVYLHDSV